LEMQFMFVLCASIIAATRDDTCDLHNALAAWLDAGDLIASFNYDLLIDRSIKQSRNWIPDTGYGLQFSKIGVRRGEEVEWRNPAEDTSDILLLKPHGSLNWLHPVDSWGSVSHMDLHGRELRIPKDKVFCLEEINPNFEDDHPLYEWWERYDHKEDDYTYDMHSLIVPPSLSKPYRNFERVTGPLWAELLDSLLYRVEELYIIGYSIRPDDFRTWWLFRKAAAQSETLERIVVIDPSDEVFARAVEIFSPRHVERGAKSLEGFVEGI